MTLHKEFNPRATNANNCHRQTRTRDMGGQATTHEFTRAVLDKMEAAL